MTLSTLIAERVIRAVYVDESVDDVDDKTMGAIQIVLLSALIADAHFDDTGLDQFMADARQLAVQWITWQLANELVQRWPYPTSRVAALRAQTACHPTR